MHPDRDHGQPETYKPCIKSSLFKQTTPAHETETRAQLQEWQIDVPWPDDCGAPGELLKWFAEVMQSALAPDKRPTQKQE